MKKGMVRFSWFDLVFSINMRTCILLFLVFSGCNKNHSKSLATSNLNCPDYYPKIENVYLAYPAFEKSLDSVHQYYYRLITFSEEEGFAMILETLRQGVVEGLGELEVVEQRNITHVKGIEDANGISLHYRTGRWISSKMALLELEALDEYGDVRHGNSL